jgi:hypothetical protein
LKKQLRPSGAFAARRERWNYVIELAFDPNNPPTQEERNQLQNAFEFISEGVRRIMDDKTGCNEVEDYTREVPWH